MAPERPVENSANRKLALLRDPLAERYRRATLLSANDPSKSRWGLRRVQTCPSPQSSGNMVLKSNYAKRKWHRKVPFEAPRTANLPLSAILWQNGTKGQLCSAQMTLPSPLGDSTECKLAPLRNPPATWYQRATPQSTRGAKKSGAGVRRVQNHPSP